MKISRQLSGEYLTQNAAIAATDLWPFQPTVRVEDSRSRERVSKLRYLLFSCPPALRVGSDRPAWQPDSSGSIAELSDTNPYRAQMFCCRPSSVNGWATEKKKMTSSFDTSSSARPLGTALQWVVWKPAKVAASYRGEDLLQPASANLHSRLRREEMSKLQCGFCTCALPTLGENREGPT